MSPQRVWIAFIFATLTAATVPCSEIHEAAEKGDLKKVLVLLKANPELVNAKDESGWTPLHSAACHNQKDVAKLLIEQKADIHAKEANGATPLHWAADNPEMIAFLLSLKADINSKDDRGRTPYHWAGQRGAHTGVAEVFRAHGADLEAKDNDGRTAAQLAEVAAIRQAAGKGDVAKLEALLKTNPALRDAKDDGGFLPLHHAAFAGQKAAAKLLLAHKADVNCRLGDPETGNTPLHLAAGQSFVDCTGVVEVLLANGADVNATADG